MTPSGRAGSPLETGAGLSTLVILRKRPRQHTAVQPAPDAFAAILEFAERHRMDIHGFRPIVARSQDWLPRVDLPDLDLVLVDGAHAFPVPFLDWYYGAEKLKVGGLMVVDDTHLPTGTMLAERIGVPKGPDASTEARMTAGGMAFSGGRNLKRAGLTGWS